MDSKAGIGQEILLLLGTALAVTALAAYPCGCTGCTLTERRDVMNVARRAVEAAKDLPPGAVALPTSQWEIYVARNAAQVYVPYRFSDASGRERIGTYVVRAKRVKLTWVLDYSRPLPDYTERAASENRP